MTKYLSDGTLAELGMKVEIVGYAEGMKHGDQSIITSIDGQVINKAGHNIDLMHWARKVQCSNGWLVDINQLRKV